VIGTVGKGLKSGRMTFAVRRVAPQQKQGCGSLCHAAAEAKEPLWTKRDAFARHALVAGKCRGYAFGKRRLRFLAEEASDGISETVFGMADP
jgi:hypothetical protein